MNQTRKGFKLPTKWMKAVKDKNKVIIGDKFEEWAQELRANYDSARAKEEQLPNIRKDKLLMMIDTHYCKQNIRELSYIESQVY